MTLDRKTIQRNRMKKYFIDSAIEIIKEEGLENVTTKKIGEKAGYSYATIYNYFENFNELICVCMIKIADECGEFLKSNLKGNSAIERVSHFVELMVDFNATNPNIYYPFLSSEVDYSYFNKVFSESHFMHPAYGIMIKELESYKELDHLSEDDRRILANVMVSIYHSKLHFYIIHGSPNNIDTLKKEILENVMFVLKSKLK